MSQRVSARSFEMWLLHRVAEAVEAGEVSAQLLMELQGELGVTADRHPGCGHVAAIRSLVDLLEVDSAPTAETQGQCATRGEMTREDLLRDVAQIWLAEQRKSYRQYGNPR